MIDRIAASEVFLASVELGSISAAAERLNMSRAMASRYVAAVETWAGVRLLHRSTRHLSLTGAGEQLLPTLKTLVALSDRVAWPGIAQSDEPCGPLRVSLSVIAAQSLMGEAFASFMARYPRVQLELLATNERVNLIEERIDLAIRITNELDPQLICRPLGQCHSVLCAAPGYLAVHGHPSHPEQLAQHQCLTYTHFGPGQWTLYRDDEVCQVAVSGGLKTNEATLLMEALRWQGGIGMLPRFAVAPLLASGELETVLPEWAPKPLGMHALYSTRQHMPLALRALIDHLADVLAESAEAGPYHTASAVEKRIT